jgi:2-polyprenyl-3-methyl-5-hydroxy-6-metoxy-1,4-benzoquinol methylase
LAFDNYAAEVQARFGRGDDPNKRRMWAKAYAPLLPEIRKARRILDHGCGSGEFLSFLAEHATGALVGYDVSPSQLAQARIRLSAIKNVTLEGGADPLQSSDFDLIFSIHVIEHIADERLSEFLRDLCTRLHPDGKLVIATPNGLNPFSYAYYMSSDRTHLRMHSPLTLAQLLVPEGLQIDSVRRELPQAYDLMTFLKTLVWRLSTVFIKLAVLSSAAGVRQHRQPLILAPTFYAVASKSRPQTGS